MDLVEVTALVLPTTAATVPTWQPGDAYLGGGTWLFSEPQPGLRRLVDLGGLDLPPVEETADALWIAASCPLARLAPHPATTAVADGLFPAALHALSASFKILPIATVGGNIALALAKGVMTPVFIALGATYELARPGADAPVRQVPAADFQTGVRATVLAPGEYLRRVRVPVTALATRAALRRITTNATGSVTALAIATRGADDTRPALTLAGGLVRPVRFTPDPGLPLAPQLVAACPADLLLDDIHATPNYRRVLLHEVAAAALAAIADAP